MKSVFKYLLDLNYTNVMVLVSLSLITVIFNNILPFSLHITAFLTEVMMVVMLLSPIIRFKSIIFGKSRILFLTPKSYSDILKGYLLSEAIIFVTYYIGVCVCLIYLKGQINVLNYFFNIQEKDIGFLYCFIYIFARIIDIWFCFTAVGMLSIILSKKTYIKEIKFLSVKIFIRFVILQFVTIFIVEIFGVIMFKSFARIIVSSYIIYLSYRSLRSLDIY